MAVTKLLKQQYRIVTAVPALAKSIVPTIFSIKICTRCSATDISIPSANSLLEKYGSRTVGIFWDMDNKPPLSLPPVKAAKRLKAMAGRFGTVVDIVIYASRHSLKNLPSWSQQHWRHKQLVEELWAKGLEAVKQGEVYMCDYCGRRYRSNYALQKHFKNLHEKEHQRRLLQLGSMKKKGKRNCLLRSQMEKKETRYKEVSKVISLPDKGYGLAAELQKAGMPVIEVSNKPQRAAIALLKHMIQFVEQGVNCLWLVSHDTLFVEVLEMARQKQLHCIVMSENPKLRNCSDYCVSWEDLGSRLAMTDADDLASKWFLEDSVRGPPHSNFLTTELTKIPLREDLRVIQAISAAKNDQNVDPDFDQSESSSDTDQFDSTSDLSGHDTDFSDGITISSDEEFSDSE